MTVVKNLQKKMLVLIIRSKNTECECNDDSSLFPEITDISTSDTLINILLHLSQQTNRCNITNKSYVT